MTKSNIEFYRYLRPVSFDKNRHSPVAKTTGGVSFLITGYEQLEDSTYVVKLVIAVCPSDQKYDKNVAKRILQVRKDAGHTFNVRAMGLDAESLAKAVVETADMNRLDVSTDDIYKNYLKYAIVEYADAIEYVLCSQRSADFLSKMSSATIASLGIGDLYRESSE